MKLGNDRVLPGYRNRAGVALNDQMSARFIRQEMAVEAAKELWGHLAGSKTVSCIYARLTRRVSAQKAAFFRKYPTFHRTIGTPVGSAPRCYVNTDKNKHNFQK